MAHEIPYEDYFLDLFNKDTESDQDDTSNEVPEEFRLIISESDSPSSSESNESNEIIQPTLNLSNTMPALHMAIAL